MAVHSYNIILPNYNPKQGNLSEWFFNSEYSLSDGVPNNSKYQYAMTQTGLEF